MYSLPQGRGEARNMASRLVQCNSVVLMSPIGGANAFNCRACNIVRLAFRPRLEFR
jgi:hypothetical protein